MTSFDPEPLPAPGSSPAPGLAAPPTAGPTTPLPPSLGGPPYTPVPTHPAPRQRGWPTPAKVTAVVLAVTTLGAAAAGVVLSQSAKSDTKDVKKELAKAQADAVDAGDTAAAAVAAAKKETKGVQDDLSRAQDDLTDAEGKITAAQTERDTANAKIDELRKLFPIDVTATPVDGKYTLTVVDGSALCTGYADNDRACAEAGFPVSLDVTGDGGTLTVASSFFDPVTLTPGDGVFVASGDVLSSAADLCSNLPSPTQFTLTMGISEVTLDAGDKVQPTRLFIDFSMGAVASTNCTATSRSAQLTAVPG